MTPVAPASSAAPTSAADKDETRTRRDTPVVRRGRDPGDLRSPEGSVLGVDAEGVETRLVEQLDRLECRALDEDAHEQFACREPFLAPCWPVHGEPRFRWPLLASG